MDKRIKVLMVDDEEQFRLTTKKILERRGFETILADSGEEAIEKVKENPDVIVLDVKMPGMDGLQALQEINTLQPQIPVIMLTGHGSEPSAKQALHQGAFDYLNKPCDIDLLASKIMDAVKHFKGKVPPEEKTVREVMIPKEEYTTLTTEGTIKDAIDELKKSFTAKISTSRLMETGHRSILIVDKEGRLQGILTIVDLLKGIMPPYLFAPKPSMADTIQYSPMFWKGMFSRNIHELGKRKIKEIMSPAPLTIADNANLMEAAYTMVKNQVRRLAVTREGELVGVVREQDLFFEMETVLRETFE
ncbi:MAG: response regulator [Deltaproteobacteria bacterium]|nr:response regulator [Deltaproteobacteria bacterium]MBW2051045.1 response regulator [Deltaproteobacteria bacterium]MBW2140964.1 response regulator [Deltaproteobacteria bacterium]